MEKLERVSKNKKLTVHLADLSQGYQLIHIGFWVTEVNEAAAVISEFNEKLLLEFQREGIPFLPPIALPLKTSPAGLLHLDPK